MESMTGFGSSNCSFKNSKLSVEIKSVNHRYFDMRLRAPQFLSKLDNKIREIVKSKLKRGSIDCYIKIQKDETSSNCSDGLEKLSLDESLAKQYIDLIKKAKKRFKLKGDITIKDLLKIPDIFKLDDSDISSQDLDTGILSCIEEASNKLLIMQSTEGKATKDSISKNVDALSSNVERIKEITLSAAEEVKNKLYDKISTLLSNSEIPAERIAIEAGIIANRTDISEEIDRLESHILLFKEVIQNSSNEVGKKLDFISQELNREINTIASKSEKNKLSQSCIECKSLIEKIREQVQNVK